MKHHLLTLSTVIISLITLITTTICYADPISPTKSKEIASRFFASRHLGSQAKQVVTSVATRASSDNQPYYIYNAGNDNGFVIVAGDDNMPTILGYSDKGNFSTDEIPTELANLLQSYTKLYALAKANKNIAKKASGGSSTPIEPLLSTEWGQGSPYNNMCPKFFTGKRCYTGCVATAMAQVLYYFYCTQPEKMDDEIASSIPAYDCETTWKGYGSIHVESISTDNYINWDAITDTYGSSSSEASKDAVANLMYLCAASVESDFKQNSTSAPLVTFYQYEKPNGDPKNPGADYALSVYFSVQNSSDNTYLSETKFTDDELLDIIKSNLNDKSPILISGTDSIKGGHAFIIDGIDDQENVHINWGWNGRYNGYFKINSLATSGGDFTNDRRVVYNLKPNGSGIRHNTTAISLPSHANIPINIYDLKGCKVANVRNGQLADTLEQLPKGVYVAKGKKYVVR